MIYFDHAATSAPSTDALSVFNSSATQYANPNSPHAIGFEARRAIEKARIDILKAFHLTSGYKLVFTSGSTEALNLAIIGYALKHKNNGKRIITTQIEHPAVMNSMRYLESIGFEVIYLKVNSKGLISLDDLKANLNKDTILVSVMSVNNEIGVINNIDEIKQIVSVFPKIAFLSDTTQAVGKINLNYRNLDMFVVSGHKINGIKGSGCLIFKENINLSPIIYGGGQEGGLRSGTESLPLCASLAIAIKEAMKNLDHNLNKVTLLNNHLNELLIKRDDVIINSNEFSSPYIFNFSLTKKKVSVVVEALSNEMIYVSSTSACQSKNEKASDVLLSIGHSAYLAKNAIRVSFGFENTISEVDKFYEVLDRILKEIRG